MTSGTSGPQQAGRERLWLLLLVAACLATGLATFRQYGASWDEVSVYRYADGVLGAYKFFFHPGDMPPLDPEMNYYGPSFFMLTDLAARLMMLVMPALGRVEAWHFVYFLAFVGCIVTLYLFSRRWLSPAASLGASLLLATQPLLWGHAFINPKDIPFMALFLASVALGFAAIDRYAARRPSAGLLVAAAVLLGLTTSARVSGPLAGAIVGAYAVFRLRKRSGGVLAVYAGLAMLSAYVTWPYLWEAPLTRFFESARRMSGFPFPTKVLFMGRFYAASQLPWTYYPVLLGIQLTLPLLVLALAGLGVAACRFVRDGGVQRQPLLLFAGWFLLPAAAIVAGRSALYDNGRQLFFLLPPLLLLAGLSLDALLRLIPSRWLQAGIILAVLAPGVYGIVRLHPYEYTYYNQLVGGTGGAAGEFESDYWGTSYREAALWLNEHAATGATLWATGPADLLRLYLRPDLAITCADEVDCGMHYDYVVTLVRWRAERQCTRADTVFEVQRRGAVFSIVRFLPPGQTCP